MPKAQNFILNRLRLYKRVKQKERGILEPITGNLTKSSPLPYLVTELKHLVISQGKYKTKKLANDVRNTIWEIEKPVMVLIVDLI